jgi:hypothetical protein
VVAVTPEPATVADQARVRVPVVPLPAANDAALAVLTDRIRHPAGRRADTPEVSARPGPWSWPRTRGPGWIRS